MCGGCAWVGVWGVWVSGCVVGVWLFGGCVGEWVSGCVGVWVGVTGEWG